MSLRSFRESLHEALKPAIESRAELLACRQPPTISELGQLWNAQRDAYAELSTAVEALHELHAGHGITPRLAAALEDFGMAKDDPSLRPEIETHHISTNGEGNDQPQASIVSKIIAAIEAAFQKIRDLMRKILSWLIDYARKIHDKFKVAQFHAMKLDAGTSVTFKISGELAMWVGRSVEGKLPTEVLYPAGVTHSVDVVLDNLDKAVHSLTFTDGDEVWLSIGTNLKKVLEGLSELAAPVGPRHRTYHMRDLHWTQASSRTEIIRNFQHSLDVRESDVVHHSEDQEVTLTVSQIEHMISDLNLTIDAFVTIAKKTEHRFARIEDDVKHRIRRNISSANSEARMSATNPAAKKESLTVLGSSVAQAVAMVSGHVMADLQQYIQSFPRYSHFIQAAIAAAEAAHGAKPTETAA